MQRIAAYLRVSTGDKQTVDSQKAEIETYLARRQAKVSWYEDVGQTGAKLDRPAFKKLLSAVSRRRVDVLVCYRLDRISRSLIDAVHVLDVLRRGDCSLVTLADGISFDGPYGALMYALVAGLAELEREAIRERVRAGVRNAQANGIRLGRPPTGLDMLAVKRLRKAGKPLGEIAAELGVSARTIQRRQAGTTKSPPKKGA